VLVLQNLGLPIAPRWHYAVVVGYDLAAGELVLRSGAERRWITPLGTFERTWARGEHWAIVTVAPGEVPAGVTLLDYLAAARDLEAGGKQAAARASYAAAARAWPGRALPELALANLDYATGDRVAAQAALLRALRREPDSAAAWNNLAHVQETLGCAAGAAQARRCLENLSGSAEAPACLPLTCGSAPH
jgi:tetratricopeptide (TPR) repeat protein